MTNENLPQIPEAGFIRLRTVLNVFPVSRSTWYAGIKSGKYPQPVKLGERISGWKVADIRALLAK